MVRFLHKTDGNHNSYFKSVNNLAGSGEETLMLPAFCFLMMDLKVRTGLMKMGFWMKIGFQMKPDFNGFYATTISWGGGHPKSSYLSFGQAVASSRNA